MRQEPDRDSDWWPSEDEGDSPGIPLAVDFLPRVEDDFLMEFLALFSDRAKEFYSRSQQIPDLTVRRGPYVRLLLEARQVFVFGYWNACVAMCGIASERIIKDLLRSSVKIEATGKIDTPSSVAFDQLERVDLSGLLRFLRECGRLSERGFKASNDLTVLRNAYAHARGKSPEADALQAIKLLHTIVEETVHVNLD